MLRHRSAGGVFMARLYDLPQPPDASHHAGALRRAWREHRRDVAGIETLDLEAPAVDRWELLCRVLPVSGSVRQRVVGKSWPHVNRTAP